LEIPSKKFGASYVKNKSKSSNEHIFANVLLPRKSLSFV
jgi:hypothetical protein